MSELLMQMSLAVGSVTLPKFAVVFVVVDASVPRVSSVTGSVVIHNLLPDQSLRVSPLLNGYWSMFTPNVCVPAERFGIHIGFANSVVIPASENEDTSPQIGYDIPSTIGCASIPLADVSFCIISELMIQTSLAIGRVTLPKLPVAFVLVELSVP